jgi:hypothetical protein
MLLGVTGVEPATTELKAHCSAFELHTLLRYIATLFSYAAEEALFVSRPTSDLI